MKKQIFVFLFSLISITIIAQNTKIKWVSFEDALKLNNQYPKKKFFIDVYTDWCGWCVKMDNSTFADSAIADYMNHNFICVKLNAERKDTVIINGKAYVNANPKEKRGVHQIAVDLLQGKMSYPSYVILGEMGNSITIVSGYRVANEFSILMHYYAENIYIQMPFNEYQQKYSTFQPK